MICNKCGAEIEENAVKCPECGEEIPQKKKGWGWSVLIMGVLVLLVVGLLVGIFIAVSSLAA